MRSVLKCLAPHCFSLGVLGMSVLFSGQALAAKNDNFRVALPEGYEVTSYQANENLDGGLVNFSENNADMRLRLQSYLTQYMPSDLQKLASSNPSSFANTILATRLKKDCVNYKVSVGQVRRYNDGQHINWWSVCEQLNSDNLYEFERGRLYISNFGTYIYSHYETGKGKDFQFSVKEVKWFDRFLANSALCESGKDCGLEGKLVDKIFVQK
ncbi:hypothetical protein KDW99_01395 [Marinomonas rhizomae]|uniref:hypothetical protein n=1 Tax=Marinomonas rhizomae TaxID=491948 RepID=UPI00210765FC|nr:hypothetical protein [Marinomonas rhizomae]UTV99831.1 hypothetical protein KDW99_01395 [Marinomonas rhizomae]